MRVTGHHINTGARQIADASQTLSGGAAQQASSLEKISDTISNVAEHTKHNAENASLANEFTTEAHSLAKDGNLQMTELVDAMAEINQSGLNISKIIKVIDEIAFQTNLLALNAAVESARAGEHGRGFAVVASEVRTLAQRSAEAAKEIKSLIEDSVAKVHQGSRMVNESGATLQKIVTSIKEVSRIIAEIASAGHEQSEGIKQVNNTITKLDDMTKQNAAMVEQVSRASQTMGEQARELSELVSFFRSGSAKPDADDEAALRAAG